MSRPGALAARIVVPDRLDADLEAEPGEVIAVVGPNGAGKTTLLRALAGLVPMQGTLAVDGVSWTDPPRLTRDRRIGFVFQGQSLFPHLSALDNVAFGVRSGDKRQVAHDWLARLGIADLEGRRPGQLSGGQAQRVAIARALATEPSLLLLDEPFTGLDVGVASALRVELGRHLREYAGIALLVTHDALDALMLADRVLVLDRGRVAQEGPPREVAARPLTEHVARLVGLNLLREGTELIAFPPAAVNVSIGEPVGSPRLRWHGQVRSAAPHGDAIRVLVGTDGPDLIADVTPAATAELALGPGSPVWLSVKRTAVTSYPAR
jgi:molybdate transport system ATP-binding protein